MRQSTCECGECKTCKNRIYQKRHYDKKKMVKKITEIFPKLVNIWECSDGSLHSTELAACQYELELFRTGR